MNTGKLACGVCAGVWRRLAKSRGAPKIMMASAGLGAGFGSSSSSARRQVTDRLMMVKPSLFGSNPETVGDNAFQRGQEASMAGHIHQAALKEFTAFAEVLRKAGVDLTVVEDTQGLPDAIFPNNWISFHSSGGVESHAPTIVTYPMMSFSRRQERSPTTIRMLADKLGAKVKDYSSYEEEGKFLEGTGSMVFDRVNKITYACLSQRTHPDVLNHFCVDFGYASVPFRAYSRQRGTDSLSPIYHTNVMLSVGTDFAVICLESITDSSERQQVRESLEKSGKEIVEISTTQMLAFAGNVLQLRSETGKNLLAMSTKAFQSLDKEQLDVFEKHSVSVVHSSLDTIEEYSGGGARCMMAEIFPSIS